MNDDLFYLKDGLLLAVTKKTVVGGGNRTSSVCYSKSGQKYRGANVDSDTHLLNLSSEQVALLLAISHQDYLIEEITTMTENGSAFVLDPLVVKIVIDFCVRTGGEIRYSVVNTEGEVIFECEAITKLIPFYKPSPTILSKTKSAILRESHSPILARTPIKDELKKYAQLGLLNDFPTHDNASSYGASVLTEGGVIYYTGQYSSFEKRTMVHSEMAAIILALMDGKTKITALGLVSTKFTDTPCEICGCCRQFFSEISSKYNLNMELYCFAKDTNEFKQYTLTELLPNQWSSKKWL